MRNFLNNIPKPGPEVLWTFVGLLMTAGTYLIDQKKEDMRIRNAVDEAIEERLQECD